MSTITKKMSLPLGRLAAWMGVYTVAQYLTNNHELASLLAGTGVANDKLADVCTGVSEQLKGIAGNRTSDYWKDFRALSGFGINHNVETAFRSALEAAPEQLANGYMATSTTSISQKERAEIDRFFQSLAHQLNHAELSADMIDQYVNQRSMFVENLLKNAAEASYEPDLSPERIKHLTNWLVAHWEKKIGLYFLEELKNDHKAEVGYSITLLEECALGSSENRERLDNLADAIGDIASHQHEEIALLRQAVHALQLVQENYRKADVEFRAYRREFQAFHTRIEEKSEPTLSTPTYDPATQPRHQILDYRLQHTTFLGREPEMNALWRFVNSRPDHLFQWWMVTGPGGIGKSRLAFEFCRETYGLSYHAGFLEKSEIGDSQNKGFDWGHWRPARPTLLVIDYVAAYTDQIRQMLETLDHNAKHKRLPHRIRVLLLERETREDWWTAFERDVAINNSRYGGTETPLLSLPPFDGERLWAIIAEVHRKEHKELTADKEETLVKLAELDTEGRPLFAFLVGLALATDGKIRSWNIDQLLHNLLWRYEEKIWKKYPRYEQIGQAHKNLLMLATLARGIPVDKLDDLYDIATAGLPDSIDANLYERMAAVILSDDQQPAEYTGLQPDLVGEYFVLRQLNELLKQQPYGQKTAKLLLQAVWRVKASEVWRMCWMAVQDFDLYFADTAIQHLIQFPNSHHISVARHWAKLQVNLTTYSSYKISDKETHFQNLKLLSKSFSEDKDVALYQAEGTRNQAINYCNDKNFSEAEKKYEALKMLVASFNQDTPIVLCQAKLAYDMISYYGEISEFDKAEEKYNDLTKLVSAFAENPIIGLQQAKGAYNQVNNYIRDHMLDKAEHKYEDMKNMSFHSAFANDSAICSCQMRGGI